MTRPVPWASMPPNRHTGLPMQPRAWQAAALPLIGDALRRGERPVVVAGTGSGKAVLLAELVRGLAWSLGPSDRVVVSAPTIALVEQLREDIGRRIGPERVGAYYTGAKQHDRAVVVVCNPSAESLAAELTIEGATVKAWIADECHRTRSDGMESAIAMTAPRLLLGLTATPYRSAETESLRLFSSVAYRYTMEDATRDGVLVPYVVRWPLDRWGEMMVDDATIRLIREYADGPGVVGASTVEDAQEFATRLNTEGIPARAISASTPKAEREQAIADLRDGRLACLVHVALLIEGVDLPWLRWLALRRPLTSPVALVQQIGRVLRSYPGKTGAVVLDPHGLLRLRSLGRPDAIGDLEQQAQEEAEGVKKERAATTAEREERVATAVSDSEQWARDLLLTMAASGAVRPKVGGEGWRSMPATSQQVASLDRMARAWSRYLPESVAEGIAGLRAWHGVSPLDRGTVSDLLSVLHAVAEQAPEGGWESRRGWGGPSWPAGMTWPELPEGAARELRLAGNRDRSRRAREEATA